MTHRSLRRTTRDTRRDVSVEELEARGKAFADRNMGDEAAEEYAVAADLAEQENHPAARRLRTEMRRMRVVGYARRRFPDVQVLVTPVQGKRSDVETWSFHIRAWIEAGGGSRRLEHEFVRVDPRGRVIVKPMDPRIAYGYGARGRRR